MKLRPLIGRLRIALLSIVVWLAVCVVSIGASSPVIVMSAERGARRSLKSTVGAEPSVTTTRGSLWFPKPGRDAVTE